MAKTKVISVANQKGGVEKSTSVYCIGAGLALQSKKVLLLDVDPQGDLSKMLGQRKPHELPHTLGDVMNDVVSGKEVAEHTEILHHHEGFDYVPGNRVLSAVEVGLVNIDDPGDVIFAQYRVGMGGRRFKLYKLRTMRLDTPKYMSTSEVDDPNRYITRAGHIFRRLSIDELPQLFNVIKGDMSIVGPRPLISDEYEIHELRIKCGVYKIRPGLTGLAQIHGRDMTTPADKVRWDVQYLKQFGFWTDVKIVLSTIPKLLGGDGFAEGFKHSKGEGSKK